MNVDKLFFLLLVTLLLVGGCVDPMPPDNGGGGSSSSIPKISIGNITQFEGDENSNFEFQVRLSEASSEVVSVDFTTNSGTALPDSDFISTQGTLDFAPSELSKIISVEIVADTLKEESEEFSVSLSNAVNGTLTTAEGIGTIRNDDDYIFIPEDGYITPESYGGYDLVWRDEFNGSELDPACWTHELGGGGWGNEELQVYTNDSENSYLANGNLIIEARENVGTGEYTSARIVTVDKKEFLFGRIDIRAKLPYGQGIWPALWMLGSNFPEEGWPNCGEIDIMELVGHEPGRVHGTAHWGPQGQTYSNNHGDSIDLNGEIYADKFHVFSIVWEFNSVKWYMDDTLYFSINQSTVGNNAYPFNQEFFFIFNIAVGGQWPGYPDGTTTFPQRMIVDYIRVFQEQ